MIDDLVIVGTYMLYIVLVTLFGAFILMALSLILMAFVAGQLINGSLGIFFLIMFIAAVVIRHDRSI